MIILILFFFVFRYIEQIIVYPRDGPNYSRWCVDIPTRFNLPYEELYIPTPDGEILHSYLILQEKNIRNHVPTVIFCHGNAGNIGQRLFFCNKLFKLCKVNILLFDYRGYGLSSGNPSENGLYIDATAVVDYLHETRQDINHDNFILFGRSLGGAVAINAAINCDQSVVPSSDMTIKASNICCALILENTFTSIPDVACSSLNLTQKSANASCGHVSPEKSTAGDFWYWLLRNQYRSIDKIDRLKMPVLFISGEMDNLIPPTMMLQLYNKCSPYHKSLHRVPQGDHNTTWTRPGYFESINNFLDSIFQKP